MQLIVQLDPESARQLALIQEHTNQDHDTIIRQVLDLYHQQIQATRRRSLSVSVATTSTLARESVIA